MKRVGLHSTHDGFTPSGLGVRPVISCEFRNPEKTLGLVSGNEREVRWSEYVILNPLNDLR